MVASGIICDVGLDDIGLDKRIHGQNHLERLITANFQVSTALINEERIA
jgi:hypothetical protein